MTWRHNTSYVTSRRNANWHVHPRAFERGSDMRFPTMCYVRPAKTQISLRRHAVWSEPLLVAWILYACYAIDWTSFRRLHRLVWVYTNLSSRVPFPRFGLFFFERTSDATIPNVAHVINRPCQGVKTSNHRNMGYGSRREKTYGCCISTTKAQTSLRGRAVWSATLLSNLWKV